MTRDVTALGLGELKASRDPAEILTCYGLGSCVALMLYDPVARVGGMAHVVLPEVTSSRGAAAPGKCAETAVPALLEAMMQEGALRSRLRARLAGGARMLQSLTNQALDMGARNVRALNAALERAGIPLDGTDTGGHHGRTVHLVVGSGKVLVSTVGQGTREL